MRVHVTELRPALHHVCVAHAGQTHHTAGHQAADRKQHNFEPEGVRMRNYLFQIFGRGLQDPDFESLSLRGLLGLQIYPSDLEASRRLLEWSELLVARDYFSRCQMLVFEVLVVVVHMLVVQEHPLRIRLVEK